MSERSANILMGQTLVKTCMSSPGAAEKRPPHIFCLAALSFVLSLDIMMFLSIANAIKLMLVIGLIAVFVVVVQSCEPSKRDDIGAVSQKRMEISQFRTGSLKKLQRLEEPPIQPMTEFVDGQGNTMKLSDFKGRYVLLNVWATWCAPCVIEMPSLNALATEMKRDDFVVLTISMDKDDAAIEDFFAKNELAALTRWRDPELTLAPKLGVRGLPITIIYNPRGEEIARVSGEADWTSEEATGLIRTVLRD